MSKPAWKLQQEEKERVIKEREERERLEKQAKLKELVSHAPAPKEPEPVRKKASIYQEELDG
jgi:hypothetical protein